MSDIFDLLNILEMLYYHVDTLVKFGVDTWLHVKQARIGVDNCPWIPDSLLLMLQAYILRKIVKKTDFVKGILA